MPLAFALADAAGYWGGYRCRMPWTRSVANRTIIDRAAQSKASLSSPSNFEFRISCFEFLHYPRITFSIPCDNTSSISGSHHATLTS